MGQVLLGEVLSGPRGVAQKYSYATEKFEKDLGLRLRVAGRDE
jgi:hypothetical protein